MAVIELAAASLEEVSALDSNSQEVEAAVNAEPVLNDTRDGVATVNKPEAKKQIKEMRMQRFELRWSEKAPSINDEEYENLESLMIQFCRVPLLAEFSRPVTIMHPEFATAYSNIVTHPVDLGHVCRGIRRRQYKNTRDVRLDVWRVFANCVKFHSHPKNQGAIPSFVSIALHLREFFNYLWQEYMLPSDIPQEDASNVRKKAFARREEDRKKRFENLRLLVLSKPALLRVAQWLGSFIKSGGRVDKLDKEPVFGEECIESDRDLDVVIENLKQVQVKLEEKSLAEEEYTFDEFSRDLKRCYQHEVLKDNHYLRLRIGYRLDRFTGKFFVPLCEANSRGVTQSSIWGNIAAFIWAREGSKKPFWPALCLGVLPPEDHREGWHRLITERNELRLPEKFQSQLMTAKKRREGSQNRLSLSYFLVEFLGTHEFMWVRETDIVEKFDPQDDPNKRKKPTSQSSSSASVVGSQTYATALEECGRAAEEYEATLTEAFEDAFDENEHPGGGGGEEMTYSYALMGQSDDEDDHGFQYDGSTMALKDIDEANWLITHEGKLDTSATGRKNAKRRTRAMMKNPGSNTKVSPDAGVGTGQDPPFLSLATDQESLDTAPATLSDVMVDKSEEERGARNMKVSPDAGVATPQDEPSWFLSTDQEPLDTAPAKLSDAIMGAEAQDTGNKRKRGHDGGRCGDCVACAKPNCGECPKCLLMVQFGGAGSRGACFFRRCQRFDYRAPPRKNLTYASSEQRRATNTVSTKPPPPRSENGFEVGIRIRGLWPNTGIPGKVLYFKGLIARKYKPENCSGWLYSVHFDDGDKRKRVPEREIYTEEEWVWDNGKDTRDSALTESDDESSCVTTRSLDDRKPCALSDKPLVVGSRCSSRWTDGRYYWGEVTRVVGAGKLASYSIHYDDGDEADHVPWSDVETAAHGEDGHDKPGCEEWSCIRLRVERCNKCVMCKKDDCGVCQACKANTQVTTIYKQACLLKMCLKISKVNKAQPVPKLKNCKFFFTDPASLTAEWRNSALQSTLEGLCVKFDNGNKLYRGVETAVKLFKWPDAKANSAVQHFYEEVLGLSLRVEIEHPLVGQGYFREWTDVRGPNRGPSKEIHGKITKCERDYFDKEWLYFTVEYDPFSLQDVLTAATRIPAIDSSITEASAFSGYFLFKERFNAPDQSDIVARCRLDWILPSHRSETRTIADNSTGLPPTLQFAMTVRGFRLVFTAKASNIRNAGLGVFVQVFAPSSMPNPPKYFDLLAGELIDLGLYAPLRVEDCAYECVHLVKNFVLCWRPEGWSFNPTEHAQEKQCEVFDITDDKTGELHSLARENPLVYVNETDGVRTPSIRAEQDPAGCLHYLMGHSQKSQGVFRLHVNGKEVELLIDYGPKYEKVRVGKGYPRLTKPEEIQRFQREIQEDDAGVIKELKSFSAFDVDQCVGFLEGVYPKDDGIDATDPDKIARSIIVAISLLVRLHEILAEFEGIDSDSLSVCDNGWTDLEANRTLKRAKGMIKLLCGVWSEKGLRDLLTSKELYLIVLVPALKCSPDDPKTMRPRDFRVLVDALVNRNPIDESSSVAR